MDRHAIGARLDRLTLTRGHVRVMLVVGLGLFFDLFDIFLAGVLGSVLTGSFAVERTALPVVLGSSFVGMFFGATFMGAIADRYGRRRAYLANLAVYSLFTFLGAFSTSAAMLIATRFAAGIGIGAQLPLADAYLSELLPAARRGRLIALTYTIGFLGTPALAFLARLLVPTAPLGVEGWRWLFVIGGLGGATIWLGQRLLPESPRWLAAVGRTAEAVAVIDAIAGSPTGNGPGPVEKAPMPRPSQVPLRVLFSDAYRARTAMFFTFQIFQTAGYYGFGTLVPLVLASKGFSVLTSLTYTTIAFLGYPVGSALSVFVVERFDRRWLIVATSGLMAGFGVALGVADSPAAIATLGILYTLVSNVFSNAFHIFQGELFPTAVRATAAGSAYGVSRLSTAAMPFVLLPVLDRFGAAAMFAAIALALLAVMLIVGLFAPSTTGRSLEEIAG
jgi:putative MFS transporter